MIAKTDLAWAAGIFDGEACLSVNLTSDRGRERSRPFIQVASVTPAIPERLKELFGGTLTYQFRTNVASRGRNQVRWTLSCSRALDVLEEVRPYLVGKGEEADVLLRWRETYTTPRGHRASSAVRELRVDLDQQLKRLHHRELIESPALKAVVV